MLTREVSFTLKDGRRAVLRNPREGDIPGLLDYLVRSAGESDFIMRYPEECAKYTPEGEAKWIEDNNSDENAAVLVCEVDGKIAGNCSVHRNPMMKVRHRAFIAIALLKEFWGQGIGTAMFREMTEIAKGWEGVTQLELEFVEGNARARALYEKMGFRIVGVRPDAYRFKDGSLHSEYVMMRGLEL
ncbi:GNAT family N-acetyltransferase [Acutalibacter sp. 1XD8-36]|uniref:GNAT family N-acetyltransferase n=1 Tax=Acutalibacter sp. 1XD8-36 TaxID=2320852 RepID=UPI00262430A5|nr:GNAT family N-acetyltransferase [Acutalibacter sp. 1XD8-36]